MRQIFTHVAAALTLALLLPLVVAAQDTGSLSGTITDAESGESIPGVNVVLTDINRGAATDADGSYVISDLPAGTYTLRASFVGYDTYETEIEIGAGADVTRDIQMESSAIGLEELVVTGYGTQRRADVTGAIAQVNAQEIEDVPAQNTEALLQGRSAGVMVSSTTGNPGGGFEVNIRGEGSIGGGDDPLYIVDGVPISFSQGANLTDRSPLNAIPPGDIESIEVLKDAAAASIYGAQAANGVVLITTKKGRPGDTRVTLTYEAGTRFQSNRFDLMNRDEWIDFQVDAYGEADFREDILPAFGYAPDTPFDQLKDFDWQEWLFEPGTHQKAGFSASGGDENTQFYLSGNWQSTGGALQAKTVQFDLVGLRSNLSQQFTDKLNVDVNIGLTNEDSRGVCQDGFFINCPFYQAIGEEPPISFPYLSDLPADFNADEDPEAYNPFVEQAAIYNPALVLNEEDRKSSATQIITNLSPSYELTPWLTARGSLGLDYQFIKENDYGTPTAAPAAGGELSRRFSTQTNITANARLNADYTFAEQHTVGALLGTEYRREYYDNDQTGVIGFNNNLIKVPSGAGEIDFFNGFNTEYRVLSYFGRANYNFDNRYLVTLISRLDGHSRFGSDRRWGFFPSISGAWRISQEDFFTIDFVDDLKLRASYGVNGNSYFGLRVNFPGRGLYGIGGSYNGQVGIRPRQLAKPSLTWEESRSINVALDWSLWNGRLTGNLDLYRKVSDRLLLQRPLPISSGYGSIADNVGSLENRGIELFLQTTNVQTEDFQWTTRLNAAINQNEVLQLREGTEELSPGSALPIAVGHSLETWKVPVWAGVNPADGRPLYYDADGNLTYQPGPEDDQFVDGGEHDLVGGFGTRLDYKGLSLDLFFNYSYGGTNHPSTQRTWTAAFGEGVLGMLVDERWRQPGDIASWPRSTPGASFSSADDPDILSTRWLYSSNYIRLRNATLSYQLPAALTEPVGLRGGRVYVSGINLLTWSTYLGIDPEVADAFEESSYPAEQQLNVGVQINL